MLKTIGSLESKDKFRAIGQSKAKTIISGIGDYSTRMKLKPAAAGLGTKSVSLLKLIKGVSQKHGQLAADKLIRAAQKHFNKDVNPAVQKRFMKINMRRDLPESQTRGMAYAGGKVASKSAGVNQPINKGAMGDIGIKRGSVGFAGDFKNNKMPDKPSTTSGGGIRPVGL